MNECITHILKYNDINNLGINQSLLELNELFKKGFRVKFANSFGLNGDILYILIK